MENNKFQELVLKKFEENEQFQKLTLQKFEENEQFQKLTLQKFEENEQFQKLALQKVEENDQFQALVVKQFHLISEQMQALTQGQVRLENDLKRLEVRMENEVIERLRGLYDDREVQNEKLDKIEQRLTDIEVDTSYLVLKVKGLEKIAK
ncbi:hypothetical protein Dred_0982 [Desulforamulus reducens MI-1]|uniref:Uncharacterized protein n=1 Tax=Desulforamulus reducens (strain ATCC BAA-1160 / DSM 100696 / MI-1) TaxID=349161 RepID=A4J364_DESRM|nr:hypothetical protein [Desulforamulus reducens]ABO49517.1 hypothetical protein Dred_0982 [Desulforamulus reducens MI-1]